MVEAVLQKIARGVVERRLETPVLLFLELHSPFTTVVHTATLFAAPIATPLFGGERIALLQEILADRAHIQRLIELIEIGVEQRDGNGAVSSSAEERE